MSSLALGVFLKKLCCIVCALFVGVVSTFIISKLIVRLTPHMRVSTVMWAPDEAMEIVLRPNHKARFSGREFNNLVVFNSHGQLDLQTAQCDMSRDSIVYKLYKKSQLMCCLKQSLGMLRFQLKHDASISRQFGIYQVDKSEDWQRAIRTTLACIRKLNDMCEDRNIAFLCMNLTTKYLVEQMDIAKYHELYPEMVGRKYNFYYPYDLLEEFLENNSIP